MALNKCMFIGNVGKDPEIRTAGSGRVANFSIAVTENWTDKASGERKSVTEWVRVSCFNDNITSVIERFVHKGSKLYVEGAMKTREYTDQSGTKRYSTEINIGRFNGQIELLDSKQSGGEPSGRASEPNLGKPGGYPQEPKGGDFDDEVPF